MKRSDWVIWLARRWFSARRASGGAASSVLSAIGIAVGVMTLVVVLGVMNGFQLGYIDSILEISSYHVRVVSPSAGAPDSALVQRLKAGKGVRSVVPFLETQVLVSSGDGRSSPLRLRALQSSAGTEDQSFVKALGLPPGTTVPPEEGILLGAELARFMEVQAGDTIELLTVRSSPQSGIETSSNRIRVAGLFRSGYYDFDSGLAFMDETYWRALEPSDRYAWTYGIKLANRDADALTVSRLGAEGLAGAEGWRDFNRSFFGALRTEKTMMLLLVGLIFVVVGVNIFQAMRRSVFERTEEMALIKALGGGMEQLKMVFVLDGLAIGMLGTAAGLVLGLLVATNVNAIFSGVGNLLNAASAVLAPLLGGRPGDFSIFSPEYFYLMEVPVRVLYPETFLIAVAAIGSSAGAAALASSRITRLEPAELLRHE